MIAKTSESSMPSYFMGATKEGKGKLANLFLFPFFFGIKEDILLEEERDRSTKGWGIRNTKQKQNKSRGKLAIRFLHIK